MNERNAHCALLLGWNESWEVVDVTVDPPGQSHLLLALKTMEKQALFPNSWNAKRFRMARIITFL
jgi:hypothetical protein